MATLIIPFIGELTGLIEMLSHFTNYEAEHISEEIQDISLCQDASFNMEKNGFEILFWATYIDLIL